jgi:hypothetical protein
MAPVGPILNGAKRHAGFSRDGLKKVVSDHQLRDAHHAIAVAHL